MTPQTPQERLQDVINVVRQLESAPFRITRDWVFRKDDITGAWADERGLSRLRVALLTPVSLAEHGLNRVLGRAGALSLKPVLQSHLRALEGTEVTAPYGPELARAVTDKLIENLQPERYGVPSAALAHFHRDYCGMGLLCLGPEGQDPIFHYGTVYDGELSPPYMLSFSTADDLVHWLGSQSDLTLSGTVGEPPLRDWRMAGNQRLNRARLAHFAAQ